MSGNAALTSNKNLYLIYANALLGCGGKCCAPCVGVHALRACMYHINEIHVGSTQHVSNGCGVSDEAISYRMLYAKRCIINRCRKFEMESCCCIALYIDWDWNQLNTFVVVLIHLLQNVDTVAFFSAHLFTSVLPCPGMQTNWQTPKMSYQQWATSNEHSSWQSRLPAVVSTSIVANMGDNFVIIVIIFNWVVLKLSNHYLTLMCLTQKAIYLCYISCYIKLLY